MRSKQKSYTRLSLEERKQIYQCIIDGKSLYYIAETLGRRKCTIFEEIKRNGGKELYNPDEAHQKYRKNKEKKHQVREKKFNAVKENDQYKILCTRMDNLEMQLEIALDAIQELKNKGNDD